MGVDSADVSLAKGLAVVKMKPGNTATLKQIQNAITKNGFSMKDSTAAIGGTIVISNGKAQLQVSGSNEVLTLIPESQASGDATSLNGKPVLVEGAIPEAKKGKIPDSIRYRRIKEDQQNEDGRSDNQTFDGAQLFFIVHIREHSALWCTAFASGPVWIGSIGCICPLFLAVVGHIVAAQALDFCDIWCPHRIELLEYLFDRSPPKGTGMQSG